MTTLRPSGEKPALVTGPACASSVKTSLPLTGSHIRALRSPLAMAGALACVGGLAHAQFTPIPDPPGSVSTWPSAMDGKTVVGYYDDSPGNHHPSIYNLGTKAFTFPSMPPPTVPGNTIFTGISGTYIIGDWVDSNDGDNIVGFFRDTTDKEHGFLANVAQITFRPVDHALAGSDGTELLQIRGNTRIESFAFLKGRIPTGQEILQAGEKFEASATIAHRRCNGERRAPKYWIVLGVK